MGFSDGDYPFFQDSSQYFHSNELNLFNLSVSVSFVLLVLEIHWSYVSAYLCSFQRTLDKVEPDELKSDRKINLNQT